MTYAPHLYCDSEIDPALSGWTIQDYTLCYALGLSDNYAAEETLTRFLQERDPALLAEVRLDSEAGCFFAHAPEEDTIRDLALLIDELVALGPHPAALPGGLLASPAAFPSWDRLLEDS